MEAFPPGVAPPAAAAAAPLAAPDESSLHQAALAYLARYASTEAGLRAVLCRRVDRWARQAGGGGDIAEQAAAAKAVASRVAARLRETGLVNDAAFAEARAGALVRAGRSRRQIAARLAAKGVEGSVAHQALTTAMPEDDDAEYAAALVLARRRRLGAFSNRPDADRHKEMAVLARAGFPQDVVRRALETDAATAEDIILRLRQG